MVTESMPVCVAGFWQLWCLKALFCTLFSNFQSFDDYLPVFRQYDGETQFTALKLSPVFHHHCTVWFHRKMSRPPHLLFVGQLMQEVSMNYFRIRLECF